MNQDLSDAAAKKNRKHTAKEHLCWQGPKDFRLSLQGSRQARDLGLVPRAASSAFVGT